jgi:hypothetical protein
MLITNNAMILITLFVVAALIARYPFGGAAARSPS